jgi:hypothetical protein
LARIDNSAAIGLNVEQIRQDLATRDQAAKA